MQEILTGGLQMYDDRLSVPNAGHRWGSLYRASLDPQLVLRGPSLRNSLFFWHPDSFFSKMCMIFVT